MSVAVDIRSQVRSVFRTRWQTRNGRRVPETPTVALGNTAVKLEGTVLYADLAESTEMVDTVEPLFAAEVYKSYLNTACRIIRLNGGKITAFDGDRVMAVFVGRAKDTSAVKAALNINWAVSEILNKEIVRRHPNTDFRVRHAVGVDTSTLWVARTGIRGSNDLVWVGRAANYAAGLCSLRSEPNVSWITERVFDATSDSAKYSDGLSMWERRHWPERNCGVYSSSWRWSLE